MKIELVEIYSDESNHAVIKHPNRSFPGSLIQGDTLYILIKELIEAKDELSNGNVTDASIILENTIERLNDRLNHYKKVLSEHGLKPPFHDGILKH